jgi:hypothetical protein
MEAVELLIDLHSYFKCYICAIDFSKLNQLAKQVLAKVIKSIYFEISKQ